MSISLQALSTMFPKTTNRNAAVTGNIGIDYFTENEAAIRATMRTYNFKAIYRGPRPQSVNPAMTRRENAVSVLLYPK
jgi:hypothetical protein